MSVQVLQGDCIQVMRALKDNSVDSIVTDPPYNLSSSAKRDTDCLRRIISEVQLPDHEQGNPELLKGGSLASPLPSCTHLGGIDGTVRVDSRVSVPECAVHFQNAAIIKHEVCTCDVTPEFPPDAHLPSVSDTLDVEDLGDFILKLADVADAPFCHGTCSCFSEPSPGFIRMTVVIPRLPGGDGLRTGLGIPGGNPDVRAGDYPESESQGASQVLAGAGAVGTAVLTLDLSRGSGEIRAASGAGQGNPLFALVPAPFIRAFPGASELPSELKPGRIGIIGNAADGTFSLYIPWHRINVSTNSRGFMGKTWDGWESPAAFQRWCAAWAAECFRVLKPGGYLLAFGGTRTYHRLACAIEDAGFDIRDSLHWIYATGMPKGLNISKAIDKAAGAKREVTGISPFASRKPNGTWTGEVYGDEPGHRQGPTVTAPVTEAAKQWEGWNTSLKPAHEPVVCAQKPFPGTVAANVLEWGTGGINVDGCRVHGGPSTGGSISGSTALGQGSGWNKHDNRTTEIDRSMAAGRWPPNLLLTHSAECEPAGTTIVRGDSRQGGTGRRPGGFGNVGADAGDAEPNGPLYGNAIMQVWDCVPGCPVVEMDEQSGIKENGSGKVKKSGKRALRDNPVYGVPNQTRNAPDDYGDTGGASRFFPVFRYQAKAPQKERVKVDGISHPTCKPLGLMRWLVRLVTPPGGTCLDLFAGSGTTGEACLDEGFNCILIEREPDYIKLIRERLGRREPTLWDSLWE